jgi:hypothetical protein
MDDVTASLGKSFRHFNAKTCAEYNTKELPQEAEACCRHTRRDADATAMANPTNNEPLRKTLNLQTYKYHSLDNYARTIHQLGTTYSYSTTTVSII